MNFWRVFWSTCFWIGNWGRSNGFDNITALMVNIVLLEKPSKAVILSK
jgi:hypothetical protein